jgi:putative acetyltransferase
MRDPAEFRFITACEPDDYLTGKKLFKEYAEGLDFDLSFQDFEQELNEIESQYNLPSGRLVLITHHTGYIGCAGVRKFENKTAELKRMYIQPPWRSHGLGSLLMEKVIGVAWELGYQAIRLDTLSSMTHAAHLYRKFGFYEIPPYRFNPITGVLYFEKKIGGTPDP